MSHRQCHVFTVDDSLCHLLDRDVTKNLAFRPKNKSKKFNFSTQKHPKIGLQNFQKIFVNYLSVQNNPISAQMMFFREIYFLNFEQLVNK